MRRVRSRETRFAPFPLPIQMWAKNRPRACELTKIWKCTGFLPQRLLWPRWQARSYEQEGTAIGYRRLQETRAQPHPQPRAQNVKENTTAPEQTPPCTGEGIEARARP